MTKQILIAPAETDFTEDLLHGLIAECGAMIRETIARLRGHAAPELRQRNTVKHIQRLSPTEGEGG